MLEYRSIKTTQYIAGFAMLFAMNLMDLNSLHCYLIKAFKDAVVTCHLDQKPDLVFQSSGTSGMERSRHLVHDKELYRQSLLRGFSQHYDLDQSVILAYTPGYAEIPTPHWCGCSRN
ncbi:MAG: hypothetical protein U5K69_26030 [Balneolaceae bacterium]|nr:hypothetical protein [Balneolaceae bacterium]